MSTEMEKYIREQKERLDVEEPDNNTAIWNSISGELNRESRGEKEEIHRLPLGERDYRDKEGNNRLHVSETSYPVRRFLTLRKITATLLILLGLAYIAGELISNRHSQNVSLATIDPLLGEKESMYVRDIEVRSDKVNLSEMQSPVINELIKELREQDIAYKEAISDLESMGNNERLVNTIFSIYERKIKLLELIIMETNKEQIYEENSELPL